MDAESWLHAGSATVLDVRSPAEFARGHIPGAISFPLFLNEERHEVGKKYKEDGKDAAVLLGISMLGPKLSEFIERAHVLAPERKIHIYCWRGGMRSESMAWLLRTAGFQVAVLKGGYKAYRNYVLQHLKFPLRGVVIGGYTGSGKTEMLHTLAEMGEQIIDLEAMANHRGSAFGLAEGQEQPSMEQFENRLFAELSRLNPQRVVWIEDESKKIGNIFIRPEFHDALLEAPIFVIEKPIEERAAFLAETYGTESQHRLIQGFDRIAKRLGGQHLNEAVAHISERNYAAAARIALVYYDKTYAYGLSQRKSVMLRRVHAQGKSYTVLAKELIAESQTLYGI